MKRKIRKDKRAEKTQSDIPTPIQFWMEDPSGNRIYIKREDEYGFIRGYAVSGSKVRIAQKVIEDCLAAGGDAIIVVGRPQSNLCSAIAFLAQKNGLLCYIVEIVSSYYDHRAMNHRLAEEFGAIYYYCLHFEPAKIVKGLVRGLIAKGCHPYLAFGEPYGKGNRAVMIQSYMEVYEEILQQQAKLGISFDYIFIGAGTGVSFAGLIAAAGGGIEKIIGISISHDKGRLLKDVQNCLLQKDLFIKDEKIHISDEALCGGYRRYNAEITDLIEELYQKTGVRLDPVYTGKAYYGMKLFLKNNDIRNANVLFIHTGGLANYFDYALENGIYARDILWRKGMSAADLCRTFAAEGGLNTDELENGTDDQKENELNKALMSELNNEQEAA